MASMKIIFGLLAFVTIGMIIGALFQLAFIRRLEESSGTGLPFRRTRGGQTDFYLRFPGGVSKWANDREAEVLRIGLECDYLRAIAKPRLQISTVVDAKTGKGVKSDVRTSSGMFLNPKERKFPIIQAIEKRIAVYAQVPAENGELIQVLRYEKDQFYRPHHDYFSDSFNQKRGGQRIATMLMYLTDNVEGGETYFPMGGTGKCSCGNTSMTGMSVKPIKGNALLFWSMGLDGEIDHKSVHGGCAVLSGEKWSATKWMRQRTTY